VKSLRFLDPYPRDAFCRWPTASPLAFHQARPWQLCLGSVPDLSRRISAVSPAGGSRVAVLCWPSRSRFSTGWVKNPRIIIATFRTGKQQTVTTIFDRKDCGTWRTVGRNPAPSPSVKGSGRSRLFGVAWGLMQPMCPFQKSRTISNLQICKGRCTVGF
jgi:hypothetical protein